MRTSRTTLAALAALPLVAALAACSTAPSASAPAGSASAAPQPSASTSASGSSTRGTAAASGAVSGGGAGSGARTTTTHRPTVAEALDTVRSYMTREVGMTRPVTGDFRWTGAGTGEVPVRPRLVEGGLGPATTVSVTRLRTVWFVTGARTDGISVDSSALTGRLGSPMRLAGSLTNGGSWRVTVTQDRYGPDVRLGAWPIDPYASGRFDTTVPARATSSTGSVIFSQDAGAGRGTLRATVVRVRFAPAPPAAPCAPERLLPVIKSWFDDPAGELYITKVNVLACRNGYAHVTGLPRINPPGHSQYDGFTMYLQDRAGRWHSLDYGTDISCDEPQLADACQALGEVTSK
ncbi:MAG TPA: hypothetical protein VEV65_13230 [Kineosporiaceae bacterium]|nr:hypothetical protein [Kineosporiaceae bacterium]